MLACLCYVGIGVGLYAIAFGVRAWRAQRIALTRRRLIVGKRARVAAAVCIALGAALLGLIVLDWHYLPD